MTGQKATQQLLEMQTCAQHEPLAVHGQQVCAAGGQHHPLAPREMKPGQRHYMMTPPCLTLQGAM
jgi:hypothetical protein